MIQGNTRQMTLRALSEDGDAGDDVSSRFKVAELFTVLAATFVTGADSNDAAVGHQQFLRRGLWQDGCTDLFGAIGQPTAEL